MNSDQRIKIVVGDLVIQLQIALARIEELEAKAKEQEAPKVE